MSRPLTSDDFAPPTDIPPGGWGKTDPLEERTTPEIPELKLVSPEDLELRYQVAVQALGINPAVVYHPCSGNYKTPSVVFPNARVVYVEKDARAVQAFKEAGLEAHEASATEYTPDAPVDLLILSNPTIPSKHPASTVRSGGYVFTNNYHGNATELKDDPDFELVGVVAPTAEGYTLDREDLEQYWQTVSNDEEFRRARAGFGSLHFATAKETVDHLKPGEGGVLERYQALIEEARQKARSQISEALAKQATAMGIDLNKQRQFLHGGQLLNADLPTKKGTVDDIYVFHKK